MIPIKNPYYDFLYSPKKYISLIKYVIKECLGEDMSSVGNILVGHFVCGASGYTIPSKYEIRKADASSVYMRLPYRDICVYLRTGESANYNTGFGIIIMKPEYTSRYVVYRLEILFLGDRELDTKNRYIYRDIGS